MLKYIKEKYKDFFYLEVIPAEKKNVPFYEKHGFCLMEDGAARQLSEPDFNDFPDLHAYLLHRSALRRNVHAHVLYTVHLDYRKFFHIIEFKLFCVSEMLEDLSVFVCNAYPRLFFSSFTLFF